MPTCTALLEEAYWRQANIQAYVASCAKWLLHWLELSTDFVSQAWASPKKAGKLGWQLDVVLNNKDAKNQIWFYFCVDYGQKYITMKYIALIQCWFFFLGGGGGTNQNFLGNMGLSLRMICRTVPRGLDETLKMAM